jgi:DNA repair photolyase
MGNEALFELRRRTLDTPHFRGIEFIEAEAKSIINHVPGNFLPFNWTINPYRGCSHACSYCQWGETPILMADGRTKPLADVRPGDRIYGTRFDGKYRRYVITEVLDHWSTVRNAYRVRLEDGTELIASGDHRFLSERGWKYVTGAMSGPSQRPYLTTNNKLMGTGRFATPPKDTPEYRRGYLCGMIRGDGHVGSRTFLRVGSGRLGVSERHHFRLALVDLEALRRAQEFLRAFEVGTREFRFQAAAGDRKAVHAIGKQDRMGVTAIRSIIEWPNDPSDDWCKGFLAGIFDAEGSFSHGIWRIFNTDPEVIDRITSCLSQFGFSFALEAPKRNEGLRPITCVRMLGELHEKLRFFHTVDPAITRKRSLEGFAIKNKAKLKLVSIENLGVEMPMYDITTGTGDFIANGVVSHNCFARVTHTYMDMNAGRDFERKIVVKVNAPDLLPKELRAKRWRGEHIAMGTATDPYQRAEGRYKLMPRIIETLTQFRNPFSILTKGTLILRDLDLIADAARKMEVSTALSIGTLDEDVWAKSEPGTPHPRARLEAVAKMNAAGIPCGVMVAPILPGISDSPEQIKEVVAAAIDAGATHVSPILLHLRPVVKDVYMEWLERTYPDLVPRYHEMYARSAYASSEDKRALSEEVRNAIDAAGGMRPAPKKRTSARWRGRAETEAERLKSEQLPCSRRLRI